MDHQRFSYTSGLTQFGNLSPFNPAMRFPADMRDMRWRVRQLALAI
jgi:hypothetical protein